MSKLDPTGWTYVRKSCDGTKNREVYGPHGFKVAAVLAFQLHLEVECCTGLSITFRVLVKLS